MPNKSWSLFSTIININRRFLLCVANQQQNTRVELAPIYFPAYISTRGGGGGFNNFLSDPLRRLWNKKKRISIYNYSQSMSLYTNILSIQQNHKRRPPKKKKPLVLSNSFYDTIAIRQIVSQNRTSTWEQNWRYLFRNHWNRYPMCKAVRSPPNKPRSFWLQSKRSSAYFVLKSIIDSLEVTRLAKPFELLDFVNLVSLQVHTLMSAYWAFRVC